MDEIYFNLFLSTVGIAGLINTLPWQVIEDTSRGPATYPRIILTTPLACFLIRITQTLKQKKEERPDFIFMDLFKDHRGFFLLALVVYVANSNILGFIAATVIYLNVAVNVVIYLSKGSFKVDKWLSIRGVCLVVTTCGVTWFFRSILRVMIPVDISGI